MRQGHRVTLFTRDSRTSAELVAICRRAMRLEREATAATALHALLVETVCARAERFDVIHCHIDSIHLPLARRCPLRVVTTLHGRLDVMGLDSLDGEFPELHRPDYDAAEYLVFLAVGLAQTLGRDAMSRTLREQAHALNVDRRSGKLAVAVLT